MNLYTGLKTTNYTFCMRQKRSLVCDVMFSSNTWLHFKTSKFDFLLFQMPRYKSHPCHVSRAQHLELFSELTQGFKNVLPCSKNDLILWFYSFLCIPPNLTLKRIVAMTLKQKILNVWKITGRPFLLVNMNTLPNLWSQYLYISNYYFFININERSRYFCFACFFV